MYIWLHQINSKIIISISTCGDIGSEVRYTAEGVPRGMYICLDPIQGGSFAGGLTAKVGSAPEASLTGQGMFARVCFVHDMVNIAYFYLGLHTHMHACMHTHTHTHTCADRHIERER